MRRYSEFGYGRKCDRTHVDLGKQLYSSLHLLATLPPSFSRFYYCLCSGLRACLRLDLRSHLSVSSPVFGFCYPSFTFHFQFHLFPISALISFHYIRICHFPYLSFSVSVIFRVCHFPCLSFSPRLLPHSLHWIASSFQLSFKINSRPIAPRPSIAA